MDDTLQISSRPEAKQAQVFVNTGDFAASREIRVGLEAAGVLGAFSLQGEFAVDAVRGSEGVRDPVFISAYLLASYILTGEHRLYREQAGVFGRINPLHPFPQKGAGAWEVTARYSYMDLDSSGIEGGVLHDATLGLNWYLNHYVRTMLNYTLAHREGFDDQHILQIRLQILF